MPKTLEKKQDLNEKYCKSVAKSVSEILKFSLREEFRNKSFQLFDVRSASQIEKEIQKKLLEMISNLNKCSKKKTLTHTKSPENEDLMENGESDTTLSLGSSNSSQSPMKTSTETACSSNPCKRSWLKISSDKYKESLLNIRYKKPCFYSQPQMTSNISPESHLTVDFSFKHGLLQGARSNFNNDGDNDNYYRSKFGAFFNNSIQHLSKKSKANHSCHF